MLYELMLDNTTPRKFWNRVTRELEKIGAGVPYDNFNEWKSDDFRMTPYYGAFGGMSCTGHFEFNFDDEKTGWGYAYFASVEY